MNVIISNACEIAMLIIAVFILFCAYKKGGYQKREMVMYLLVMLPVLYFSINMVTEAVTVDEPQYEECISDIRNLKNYVAAIKCLYEYKLTQLIVGTMFLLIPDRLQRLMDTNVIWMIYKCIHWLLMYGVSIGTFIIWRKGILNGEGYKKHLTENVVLALLVGLPLSCLLMKVTNYDAGSTYPAIMGLSLIWAAFNKDNVRLGFYGTVITALAVLDKWTALPYWAISVILFAMLASRNLKSWGSKLGRVVSSVTTAYGAALVISSVYFIYAYIQQGGFCRKIDTGVVIFSFVHAVKAIVSGDLNLNSSNADIVYVPVLLCGMVILSYAALMIYEWLDRRKINVANMLLKINGIVILSGIILGVIGTYFVPLKIAPFLEIGDGEYISRDSFDGWVYHFGAKTAWGHFVSKMCYAWATVIVNYPTAITLMVVFAIISVMVHKLNRDQMACLLILSSAIFLLIFYVIAGLPSDARYYSYPMFVIVLTAVYLIYMQNWNSLVMSRIIQIACYAVYLIEMSIFIPNVKSFSPVWVWHGAEHNNTVRTGEWYAGEIMFWGEQVAIAGNIVKEIEGKSDDVVLYFNYGTVWSGNPGYTISDLQGMDAASLRFDEKAYYVINKFWIFRGAIPSYIYDVEPVAKISYKGEAGAWIYRGDQLKGYANELTR